MEYRSEQLVLEADRLRDSLGEITLADLADVQPQNPTRLTGATPLIERLWRIALTNVESNIVKTTEGTYFGAGSVFGVRVYTRDISYSGLLGLNELYPDLMRQSLEYTRLLRFQLGFKVSVGHVVPGIDAPWQEVEPTEKAFLERYHTNSYSRRTDDVVWLWCAADLAEHSGNKADWEWIYDQGKACFATFYAPFFDPDDGLYRGQATFIDAHYEDHKATGYPQEWSISDCVKVKATSTNALYVKGLQVIATACEKLGLQAESRVWHRRGEALKEAMRKGLRNVDGTFVYYKDFNGKLSERRDALGAALTVLVGVVSGDEAVKALANYPVTDVGVPLIQPFFPPIRCYHNLSSWPFVDTFFLQAKEQVDRLSYVGLNMALLARTCRGDGFHEVVDFRDGSIRGSGRQLWSAAAFIDTCRRAGLLRR